MTTQHNDFPTVAQAIATVETWTDLTPQRRRTLVTGLRTLVRAEGRRSAATLRLEPAACVACLDRASAVGLGLSAASLMNRRAALRAVLRRLSLLAPVHRHPAVADPAWSPLLAALPRRFHPHRLRAFMSWCAGEGIAPAEVTGATLAAYLEHRTRTHGGPNLRADAREVARLWNRMRETLPGWPQAVLTLPQAGEAMRALPFAAYGPSLAAEVEAFEAWAGCDADALADDLALEEDRPALRPATVAGHRKVIRLLLWGAVQYGHRPEELRCLRDLLVPRTAADSLQWHLGRLGRPDPRKPGRMRPTPTTGTLGATLLVLARYLRLGEAEVAALRRLAARVQAPRHREVTPRVEEILRRLDDPAVRLRLLRLPATLMGLARPMRDGEVRPDGVDRPPRPRDAANLAALAAAVQVLLLLPLRAADLASLRLGHEWQWQPARRGRRGRELEITLDTAKTGSRVQQVFSGAAADLLWEYETQFRPHGPHPGTAWLFPGRDRADAPRPAHHLSGAIAGLTLRHVGLRLPVHAFRAIAADTIVKADPHAQEDARLILGHASVMTAARHYRRQDRLGAGRRLDALLAEAARPQRAVAAPPRKAASPRVPR